MCVLLEERPLPLRRRSFAQIRVSCCSVFDCEASVIGECRVRSRNLLDLLLVFITLAVRIFNRSKILLLGPALCWTSTSFFCRYLIRMQPMKFCLRKHHTHHQKARP